MAPLRNILVTAANGDLAEAISGVLNESFPDVVLHGVDSGDSWPGAAFFATMRRIPRADAADYPKALAQMAAEVDADIIIPCFDGELRRIATDQEAFRGLPILLPQASLVETFTDKLETARWLEQHSLPTPKTVSLDQAQADLLPLIAKPRFGSGSRGIYLVRSAIHLEGLKDEYGDSYVAQTYLEGDEKEYTCAVLRICGVTRSLVLKRRLDAGRTIRATVIESTVITEVLTRLALAANLSGPLNIQLRLTLDGPSIFEVNPRLSSTVKMRHMLGFQDLVWAIQGRNGTTPPPFTPTPGATVYRLSREILGPALNESAEI